MTTKLALLFSLCLAFGGLMLACGGGGDSTNSGGGTTTASGDKIGVAECDEYIQKYEACLGKVPGAAQATYKQSLDTMRTTWKKAAETPQGKAALAQGCKTALDTAKTSMSSFGCSW